LANTGTLTVGTASVLNVAGNFTQSSPGALDDQIGGAPGSGLLGKITVSGAAMLGGIFNLSLVNSFTPTVGQSFPVASFASENGNFASLSGLQSVLSETLTSSGLSLLAGNPADLKVSSASAPATALAGQQITVNWQVTDAGGQAASGSWQDSVYLSSTPTITASSILLGTTQYTLGLGSGKSYNGSLTAALPAVAPGNYYVLVQADSLYQSPDSNRANNTLAAAGQIAISLPTLTLGTPLAGAFTAADQSLYYQVSVPLGGSLTVALASAAGAGSTALYVSQGTLPTPYSYQYAANVANQPNQTLIVPQTLAATVYYILAQSVSGAAATAGFTLTAAQTNAVGVSAVSATTGGNTGKITLEIDGTNFTSNATASLKLGPTTLNATAIDFVSSSQLFATFNLAGAAVGSYALSVQQGGQTATAASTFNVVAAPASSLSISLSVPQAIRPDHTSTIVISYTNSTDNDIVAPLLEVTSTNSSVLFSTPDDPNDFVSSAQLLAVAPSGPAGIVRPGQSGQLSLTILSNDTVDNDQIPIQVSQLTAGQT
ncbi:MAG TPA: CARDB domain-containing protein, partial [Pirellulales bacterium]|nr:CARDB domain-containing protein [Pirellulales bacterium]